MSNVVAFRPRASRVADRRQADLGQILLFTGVRYIRDADQAELSELPLYRLDQSALVHKDPATARLKA